MIGVEAGQKRFFIALLPPVEVQQDAATIIEELGQRYRTSTAKAPPHITLQPPFLWAEVSTLENHLATFASHQSVIPIHLSGFGAFAPRVLYINVLPTPALLTVQTALSRKLETELGIVDPMAKRRPFAPHLTVASRNVTRQTFRQAWVELRSRQAEWQFVVERLTLLIHDGHRWQIQAEFPFAHRFPAL
ncbi:2'-5' RNA ligase family protein [Leptolyngbya sp. NK1-12]|uniref:2'-5' RNA ligase family protein n=1 Tax=Leptolyngbya sp. NK1-12 TaxID=2547451 RepID=A0AA96WF61_9CYAN|nr:2'-5' RNA ligase family protein [Leptolyngbya sp. NK1-12]